MDKLISAEALLLSVRDDPEIDGKHFARFKEHINHAPDAVKHGRWIKKAAYNDGVLNTVACSACDTFQPIGCWDYYDYCPHCGAKMDGGNEDV